MADLGIYHFGTRFYSPTLGRFLSADPIVPDPLSSQAFNRYSYGYNNPLRFTDPGGHEPCDKTYNPGCWGPYPMESGNKRQGLRNDGEPSGAALGGGSGSSRTPQSVSAASGSGGNSGGSNGGDKGGSGLIAHWGWVPGPAGGFVRGWVYYSAGSSGGKSKHIDVDPEPPPTPPIILATGTGGGRLGGQTCQLGNSMLCILSGAGARPVAPQVQSLIGKPPGLASLVQPGSSTPQIFIPCGNNWDAVIDCALSLLSWGLSFAVAILFAGQPIDTPLILGLLAADVLVTWISVVRTDNAYAKGQISANRRDALNSSAWWGLVPFLGILSGLDNFIFTATGNPP